MGHDNVITVYLVGSFRGKIWTPHLGAPRACQQWVLKEYLLSELVEYVEIKDVEAESTRR